MSVDDQAVYKDLPSLVMQRPMKVHYKGDETVPSELVTRIAHMSDYRVCISEQPATLHCSSMHAWCCSACTNRLMLVPSMLCICLLYELAGTPTFGGLTCYSI